MKLLTCKAAALYLGIAADTLREYERRGLVISVRFPSLVKDGPRRRCQFTQEALDAFIAGHTAGHNSEIELPQMIDNKAIQKQGQPSRKLGNVLWMQSNAAK